MSWDPPTTGEVISYAIEPLIERVDVTNQLLDKILTLLKALYEART